MNDKKLAGNDVETLVNGVLLGTSAPQTEAQEQALYRAVSKIGVPLDTADIPEEVRDFISDKPGAQIVQVDGAKFMAEMQPEDIGRLAENGELTDMERLGLYAYGASRLIKQLFEAGPERCLAAYGPEVALTILMTDMEYQDTVEDVVTSAMMSVMGKLTGTVFHRLLESAMSDGSQGQA